jgi:hypothetical protein
VPLTIDLLCNVLLAAELIWVIFLSVDPGPQTTYTSFVIARHNSVEHGSASVRLISYWLGMGAKAKQAGLPKNACTGGGDERLKMRGRPNSKIEQGGGVVAEI